MRLPQLWLSVLSINSIFLLNLGFPLLTLSTTLHRGEVIAQTDPNAEAERLLEQGVELFRQGTAESYKQAIVAWEKALQLFQQVENLEGQAVSLFGLGKIYSDLGDKQQALEYYNQSLPLAQQVGNKVREAVTLYNIGSIYSDLGDKQQALEYYNQSLPLRRQVEDIAGEATTLYNIGSIYSDLGDKQQALEYFNQSLPLLRQIGEEILQAHILHYIGDIYDALGEKQKSLNYYQQSLLLWQIADNYIEEATTLRKIGKIYGDIGQKQKAINFYQQSIESYEQFLLLNQTTADQSQKQALVFVNMGQVYSELGEKQKALEYYQQALTWFQATNEYTMQALTLTGIGLVYSDLGDYQTALKHFQQSMPLLPRVDSGQLMEVMIFNYMGKIYLQLGEYQRALEYLDKSLLLSRKMSDYAEEAMIINNIGAVYLSLGEYQRALEYLDKSLLLSRKMSDYAEEANTLNSIGSVYLTLKEYEKALKYLQQSLTLFQRLENPVHQAHALSNIGIAYSYLGEKQKALDYYQKSLSFSQAIDDRIQEATTINNIGKLYTDLGEHHKGLESFQRSLLLSQNLGIHSQEATILFNLAYWKRSQGKLSEALTDIESAINIFEELRTKIISQDLRTSYFSTVYGYYEFYIDLLMELHQQNPNQGYDTKALHASERGRARSLLDILAESGANIKEGVDPELLAEEQILLQRLNALDQSRQLNPGERDIEELKQEIETVRRQLQNLEVEIKRNSPQYANLKYPEPLTASEIQQQVLDDETVLLMYSLGEERSFLWLVSTTEVKSYQLPKRKEIEQLSQSFLAEIESKAIVPASGEALSQVLLSTVLNQLGNKRLVIVGDGILQTVPFAALPISSPLNPPILGDLENLKKNNSPQSWGARGATQLNSSPLNLLVPVTSNTESIQTSSPLNPHILNSEASADSPQSWGVRGAGNFELISETLQTKGNLKKLNSPQSWGDKGGLSQSWEAKLISTESNGSQKIDDSSLLLGGTEGGKKINSSLLLGGTEGGQTDNLTSPPAPLLEGEGSYNSNSSPLLGGTEGSQKRGYTPLIVRYEIIILPSASSLDILRKQVQGRTPASKKVAVIADPVFEENDPRFQGDYQTTTDTRKNDVNYIALRQSTEDFLGKSMSRLEYSRQEAEGILALVPDNLEQLALDFNATRQAATDSSLSQYQIVHFATHGLLNETQPELSGLVFSLYDQQKTEKPGFLQLNDIFNLTLSADLVVLSACETGIGQEIRGEGLVSLTRGFMYAGAERLVVSLWAVADSSTSEFMQNYYRKILETGSNPATAMRETQLEMLQSEQYNSPYFWAPFVFQGEWKDKKSQ